MPEHLPEQRRLSAHGYWAELPPVSPQPAPTYGGSPDSVSFGYIYRVLRRHVWLVLAAAVLGLLGGMYLALQVPRVFRATAVLRLADSRRALTGIEDPNTTIGRYADPLHSLVQLLTSRQVARAVVDSLGLRLRSATEEFPIGHVREIRVEPLAPSDSIHLTFSSSGVTARQGSHQVRAAYGAPVVLNTVRFTIPAAPEVESAVLKIASREVAVDGLIGKLDVLTRANTDVVDVAYEDPSARRAQQIVNATVQAFQSNNITSAQESARRRRIFLDSQLRETDSMLKVAQGQLSRFRSAQQVASSSTQLEGEQAGLMAIEGRIGELAADRQTFAALLARLKGSNAAESAEALRALAGTPGVTANPFVSSQYTQLLLYQTRLDSALTGPYAAAETNPDIIQLRSLIKGTRENLVSAVSSQITSLDARIKSLQTQRATGGSSIERLPSVAAEEMEMARKVETLSKASDQLRQELQSARMSEVVEAGEVQIVNLADVPYVAVWTGAPVRLALGLLLGLLLGGSAAFFLERMNTSIRRPEELESMMPVPGLAVIPMIQPVTASKSRLGGLLGRGRNGSEGSKGIRGGVGSLPQPLSIGTEAFRMLRTSLVWSESGESLRTIVVTSAAPGEGKTITAANLAVIFAHEGRKVLLVDCDVRRPKLHTMLRVPRSPGLVDLLRSDVDMADLAAGPTIEGTGRTVAEIPVPDYIRTTGIRGLHLLPCGRMEPTMADLSSAARLRRLLNDLGKWFDVVILDTPPVLAVADAGILGTMADGVLLVVRAGQTDRVAILRAHQHLAQIGARVVGTVFNDPDGEVTGEGGYYYPYDYAVQSE